MAVYTNIGRSTPRRDGADKVTGSTQYTGDLSLPGILWGRCLRSPWPHARIVSIDTTAAEQLPGVHAVLTGADVSGIRYGRRLHDVPVLAEERVRFVGERVAAVAAVDRETAEAALLLIDVEYEELLAVFDPEEALGDGAPVLHPDFNGYYGLPRPLETPSNAFVSDVWGKGDVEAGFREADLVVDGTYTVPRQHQAYLEGHSCLVWIDEDDRIQVWASNKVPYQVKEQLTIALDLPKDRIRLNPVDIGGDYGGKGSPMDIPVAYFLAAKTGRPVRMAMDSIEEFTAGNPRHAATVHLKTGVKRDGTLTAQQARVLFNSGAYGGFKPAPGCNLGGAAKAGGPYRIPHVHIEGTQVYTNTVPGGFMRAPGEPQVVFAAESHMDEIARQLNLDPVEFRLKNLLQDGDIDPIGTAYQEIRARQTVEAAVATADYRSPKIANTGRGIAVGERAGAGGESHAAVTLNPDGSALVNSSIFEPGTGTYTVLSKIVAEELGLSVDRVRVEVWDTDAVEFDTGVGGSRVTRMAGLAAMLASADAAQQLYRITADLFGWPEEQLAVEGEAIVRRDTGERRPWTEVLERIGGSITGRGSAVDPERSPVTSFTAQVAEVSVDPETGQVRLLRLTTAHDVGAVLNPLDHQGQIDGAVIQGVGFAMTEELGVEDGRVSTVTFGDYKIPGIADIPRLDTVLLESDLGSGPYHARGIGENPSGCVAPAIANAVADAVGARMHSLPITAEKVYHALTGGLGA